MIRNMTGEVTLPLVGIAVVNSRQRTHPDWVKECLESVEGQIYPKYKICIVENYEFKFNIGQCRNKAVEDLSDCEWILFVDDDDIITPDYLFCLANYARLNPDTDWISSYSTFFYENQGHHTTSMSPIGMWKTKFLKENPFSHRLTKFEDVELINKLEQKGCKKAILKWVYGYYYRQHPEQNSRTVKEAQINPENNSKVSAYKEYKKLKELIEK